MLLQSFQSFHSNSVALYNEFDKVIIELTAIDTTELNHLFVFSGGDGETTWQINPNQCLPLVVEDDPAEYPSTWHSKKLLYFSFLNLPMC